MTKKIQPGDLVKITKRLMREGKKGAIDRFYELTGTVDQVSIVKTDSWHARRHDRRLHLLTLVIRKDDDELSSVIVDPGTQVDVLVRGQGAAATDAE